MFYFLDCDTDKFGKIHSFKQKKAIRGMSWIDGQAFSLDPEEKFAHKKSPELPICLVLNNAVKYAPLPSFDGTPVPIISKDLLDILKSHNIKNIEYYPASLESQNGEIISADYVAFKTLGFVEKGNVVEAKKRLFFRMEEHNTEIIVHESLKSAIESANIPLLQFFKFSGVE